MRPFCRKMVPEEDSFPKTILLTIIVFFTYLSIWPPKRPHICEFLGGLGPI